MIHGVTRSSSILVHAAMALGAFGAAALAVWSAPQGAGERIPHRILLGMTSDPAHSQSVTWRTVAGVEFPQAQVTPWSGNPLSATAATTVRATAAKLQLSNGLQVTHYAAAFGALEPGKEYAYRVGDGTVWSEWNHFRAAAAGPEKFRFIYLGDAQRDVKAQWSRVARMAFLQAPDARFIAHAGDLIDEGYDDALWGEWCDALGFIGAIIPNIATPGNHDMNLPPAEGKAHKPTSVSPLWRAHLAMPSNGPADAPMLNDEAYFVDYQGMRLISFEANAFSDEDYDSEARQIVQTKEVEWVERVLKDNPNKWTVVLHHEPIYKAGRNSDNPKLRDTFVPLYDKYHVDLVLAGHDHVYARTAKLAGGKVVDPSAPGTVYAVSVSGPRMYPYDPVFQPLMAKTLSGVQMFQIVEIDGDRLQYDAYSAAGNKVDSFELRKRGAGSATYAELSAAAGGSAP